MYEITSNYLSRENFRNNNHNGIDFAMEEGTQLKSLRNGVVEKVVDYGDQNIGKGVFIKFENGHTAIYGHMSEINVSENDVLMKGDIIGKSGNTGNVVGENGGYHLHFGVKNSDNSFVDPSDYIGDIQNMNKHSYKLDIVEPLTLQDFANEQINIYGSILENLNLNLITGIDLINNSMLIKNFQYFFNFIP